MDLEAALEACDAADAAGELYYSKIADQSTVSRSTFVAAAPTRVRVA